MIIYNPHNERIVKERIEKAEQILNQIPAKHCFITGSFLYKENYKDIDIFVITRSKKKFKLNKKKAKITIIDFNNLHSLFYHSISKSCIAKNILPKKSLKVTISDYWSIINEAVPTLLNEKNKYHKNVRFLILYTEYFKTNNILDTFQLNKKIEEFKSYKEILKYIEETIPPIMNQKIKSSYLKKFFYTQAGVYKDVLQYDAQRFLYQLSHKITRGTFHG
ncbi:MAG: hypothetical protein CMH61_01095 [Nanoarchaeota archaeon]|nr:hypothetical protein [Nanoarchaeota archaeon]|tara:strand:+ start:622 stop:1281 length:660 start_codon:yes stop_codon:yes gene_type:complete